MCEVSYDNCGLVGRVFKCRLLGEEGRCGSYNSRIEIQRAVSSPTLAALIDMPLDTSNAIRSLIIFRALPTTCQFLATNFDLAAIGIKTAETLSGGQRSCFIDSLLKPHFAFKHGTTGHERHCHGDRSIFVR